MTPKRTPYEMAKDYYPKLWDKERIRTLADFGKITPEQYKEITGEEYA